LPILDHFVDYSTISELQQLHSRSATYDGWIDIAACQNYFPSYQQVTYRNQSLQLEPSHLVFRRDYCLKFIARR